MLEKEKMLAMLNTTEGLTKPEIDALVMLAIALSKKQLDTNFISTCINQAVNHSLTKATELVLNWLEGHEILLARAYMKMGISAHADKLINDHEFDYTTKFSQKNELIQFLIDLGNGENKKVAAKAVKLLIQFCKNEENFFTTDEPWIKVFRSCPSNEIVLRQILSQGEEVSSNDLVFILKNTKKYLKTYMPDTIDKLQLFFENNFNIDGQLMCCEYAIQNPHLFKNSGAEDLLIEILKKHPEKAKTMNLPNDLRLKLQGVKPIEYFQL